jgi:hypothetical protein
MWWADVPTDGYRKHCPRRAVVSEIYFDVSLACIHRSGVSREQLLFLSHILASLPQKHYIADGYGGTVVHNVFNGLYIRARIKVVHKLVT